MAMRKKEYAHAMFSVILAPIFHICIYADYLAFLGCMVCGNVMWCVNWITSPCFGRQFLFQTHEC